MLDAFLGRENQAKDVQVELPVEVLFRDAFERGKLVDARVVDEYVERAECFLDSANKRSTSVFFATSA